MAFLLISIFCLILNVVAWSQQIAPGYEIPAYGLNIVLYVSFIIFYIWAWRDFLKKSRLRVLVSVLLAIGILVLNLATFYYCFVIGLTRIFEYGRFSRNIRFPGYREVFFLWDSTFLDPETIITMRCPFTPYLTKKASLWGVRPQDIVIQQDGDKVKFLRPWGEEYSFIFDLNKD